MKIQNSRNSKQDDKDYSAVCHQQGRMITDFDLNEQALISRDRLNLALKDVIGSGTPRCDALLQVDDENIPSLHWGIIYVDGIRAEARVDKRVEKTLPEFPPIIDPDISFADRLRVNPQGSSTENGLNYAFQLYYPQAPELPNTSHKLYVDVWDRTVIWLEDDKLRDPGLYGADTTTRTQTMAQVKWCDQDTDPMCLPTIGNARLHLRLRSLSSNSDPCDPCAEELELNEPVGNYHFRAEIHDVHYDDDNNADMAVLKWSSENGAEAYKATDTPPDFASNQFVYEYFDEISEKQLGRHLAHDNSGQSLIDGKRINIQNELSDAPPKDYIRRWNGWCKIEKTGSDWKVTEGFEGPFDLTSDINSGPGKVTNAGNTITIELDVITLKIELDDHALLAGDYWNTAVRESIHTEGDVLLQAKNSTKGALPDGEHHHYMLLVNVDVTGNMSLPAISDCDKYKACQPVQFPSLTDLRADDICFDNSQCELTEAKTVQGALDQLCKKNDLPWHNKHLHGWGIVCGLALTCDKERPETINLSSGYALDCEGRDLIIDEAINIDVIEGLKKIQIAVPRSDENQGVCLYLHRSDKNQLTVQFELYEDEEKSWQDRLQDKLNDSLLLEFYNECVVELIDSLKAELSDAQIDSQCFITECGKQYIPPTKRRTLAISNIAFHRNLDQTNTILNVSACEHSLLQNLYDNLLKILRSKTFCGQLNNGQFPDYPFKDSCRATWFTPKQLDQIRIHPNGKFLFGWRRNSSEIYVFNRSKSSCTGDLFGIITLPGLSNSDVSDLIIDAQDNLILSRTFRQQETFLLRSKFSRETPADCNIKLTWKTTLVPDSIIVKLAYSPWSGTTRFFAVALCKGIFSFDANTVFDNTSTNNKATWNFPASGHLAFDINSDQVFATAYQVDSSNNEPTNSCENGYYNQIMIFNGRSNRPSNLTSATLLVNDNKIEGNDNIVIAASSNLATSTLADSPAAAPRNTASAKLAIKANTSKNYVLYMVINEGLNKVLCRFQAKNLVTNASGVTGWQGDRYHSFGVNDHIDLKYIKKLKLDGVVACRYNQNDIQYIPGDPRLYDEQLLFSIPVQTGPVNLVNVDTSQQIFILNHQGQSITVLDYDLKTYQQQRQQLGEYRESVLNAYTQLLSRVLQYLKDCFCHKLLIECPECDEDDKVYLGCVTIKDNLVHNICNFSKRKYVKTFPTMSYWLSIIPIGPIVSWAIEEICCLIIPNFNSEQTSNTLTLNNQQLNLGLATLNINQSLLSDKLTADGKNLFKKTITSFVNSGQEEKVSLKQIEKAQYTYKPGVFKQPATKVALASNNKLLKTVTRVERQNTQILTQFEQNDADKIQAQTVVTDLKMEIKGLQDKAALVNSLENKIASLEQQKSETKKHFSTLEADKLASEKNIMSLTQQIKSLEKDKNTSDALFVKVQKQLKALVLFQTEAEHLVIGKRSINTLKGISKASIAILLENKITTITQLAGVSAAQLNQFGLNPKTSDKLIKIANTSLKPKTIKPSRG